MTAHAYAAAQPAASLRRVVEATLAAVVLVLVAPLLVVIAIAIIVDSPGPVLFRQVRVGMGGRAFAFHKFRTMYLDASERWPELYEYRYSDEQLAKEPRKFVDDPRVTRVGRWLRRTSLDELPNLIDVVTGHMALVGPRPELPEMLSYYSGGELMKFSVRPGITGLAQVSGRGELSFAQTIEADLDYVQNRSLAFDVALLARTVPAVLGAVGAK